jgi:DNA-binding LacI/PurR family transcriptional regulator
MAAISDLSYRPRAAAQVLASRKTNTLGLIFSEISGDFLSPLLRGIEAEATHNGFALLVYASHGRPAPIGASQPLGENNTDGVLVFVDSLPDAELARFARIGFPVVLIQRSSPPGLNIPCVTIENKRGARKLVDHLVEVHGYRRIAFLSGQAGHEDSYWREMGYRESLAAHGIPVDPGLIAPGGFDQAIARSAVEGWLARGLEFDAIFAGDDESAVGVLAALKSAGRRVPEDVAVAGFDDTYLSQYLAPPLTTVCAPIEQVGREAILQLVSLIREGQADPLTLLPTQPVIRRSCGCFWPLA